LNIALTSKAGAQPQLYAPYGDVLWVAIASLALGGAEKIVLDWAARIYPRWRVRIIVLHNQEKEWAVPNFVEVIRLNGTDRISQLEALGNIIAQSPIPVCTCHLLRKEERDALTRSGAKTIPVIHNSKDGWLESATDLTNSPVAIAVSDASAQDLKEHGWNGAVSVIRHIPFHRRLIENNRILFRKEWNIPEDATVIGMIGAIKPQKDYLRALHILKEINTQRDVYLVIIGGPLQGRGRKTWDEIVATVHRLGLRHRVAMPGFVPDAVRCLPAFDLMLNTSKFEGLSMATLEALAYGMPVVASHVGGQGELGGEGLTLIPQEAMIEVWCSAILPALTMKYKPPSWTQFPAYRLWTIAGIARDFIPTQKVLFLTANLNAGGAQRSLTNLAVSMKDRMKFQVAVTGSSTTSFFFEKLQMSGVDVIRAAEDGEPFTNAEHIVEKVCSERIGTVCFWNVDPRVKLLVVKALSFTQVRFVDASPGDNSFDEMEKTAEFQRLISFSSKELYDRLDALVMKYEGSVPAHCKHKTIHIPNGVPLPSTCKEAYEISDTPTVVVSGRIAATKFLLEIIEAMRLVRMKLPNAELHVFGAAESRERAYAEQVFKAAESLDSGITFHGPNFNAMDLLPRYDAYAVLGKDQGCPNALLEALACGMPSVGNDSGGTRAQIINGSTGILLPDTSPENLAAALITILTDREIAERMGRNGRKHVRARFSMEHMCTAYQHVLWNATVAVEDSNSQPPYQQLTALAEENS
jgi:glycosyltransferase involved in cell wall biosynthesis